MTREKAKEMLIDYRDEDRPVCKWLDAINMAIKALEETEWIPVTERLPEEHERVLVCDRTSVYMANRHDDWWYFSPGEIGMVVKQSDISAWRPLPEPYKEEV